MNRTSIAVVVTSKCSIARWIKRTCMARVHTCWCSDQIFVGQEPRRFMSSSAIRARIIWSTRRSVAKTMFSHISTHWSFNQITHTKCWSITRKLNLVIWKMTGTFWHQRKSRIQMQANQKTGTKEWVNETFSTIVIRLLTGEYFLLANNCRSRWQETRRLGQARTHSRPRCIETRRLGWWNGRWMGTTNDR